MTATVSEPGDTSTATKTITHDDIEAFADLTGDDNPLHLDSDYASETMFDSRIAHGTLVEGVISAALADLPGLVIYLGKELTFNAPVRAGDTVTATATVTDRDDNDHCTVQITTTTDDGTEVVTGTAMIMNPVAPDEPESESVEATLYFDGASRGNPGEAATGFVIENRHLTIEDGTEFDELTNNEAEYHALIEGLEYALGEGVTDITVKGDSQLVIRQVTGEYACNAENLTGLLDRVHELLEQFNSYTITHVPRERNERADTAANNTLDA